MLLSLWCIFFLISVSLSILGLTPAPIAYNNSPTTDPRVQCVDIGPSTHLCPGNGTLDDMDTGSADLDASKVLAWDREVSIAFTFAPTKVNRVNLFFYNIPSSGIGLPPAELYWGITDAFFPENFLSHVIVGNQDLSQNDRTPRNVSLVVTTDQNNTQIPDYRHFGIRFTFPETSLIDWILLSEVQLCREAGVCVCVCVCVGGGGGVGGCVCACVYVYVYMHACVGVYYV